MASSHLEAAASGRSSSTERSNDRSPTIGPLGVQSDALGTGTPLLGEELKVGVLRGVGRAVGGLLAGVFGLLRGVLQGVGSLLRRLV